MDARSSPQCRPHAETGDPVASPTSEAGDAAATPRSGDDRQPRLAVHVLSLGPPRRLLPFSLYT
ncbi:hypothetical protein IscW_ISCW003076 [Ixodes scapularis]|uniref:Uncharacterized protein n=1 Tax=Ixodes scapularis TaxID=6945 RepID=B7P9M4_IXOSC|nr:hypothetical protein IscW_ISCW003076 [Ixodes scapularis]|eukprot:XP_002404793.1 hypothetical protein IscW_ISCW003076 [Ixodes scapularis]